MTRVQQTRFNHGGNCLAACIVSILDRPGELEQLSDIIAEGTDWETQRLAALPWLRERGYTCIPFLEWDDRCDEFIRGLLCIASGLSPRGFGHGVVWRDGLVWDPHPERTGLAQASNQYTVLVPLAADMKSDSGSGE